MRILAVNTDPIILEVLVQLLVNRPDYDALAALTTGAATALLDDAKDSPFDCILIDADVDQADKIRFMTTLQLRPDCANTPVMMMTADTSKAALDAAFAAGATDIMPKPFEINALHGRLALLMQAASPQTHDGNDQSFHLQAALPVFNTDACISYIAFENYGKQLARHRHNGPAVFAFAVNDIARLHRDLSPFAFHSMINDVAGILADEMAHFQHFMAYAGSGVFVVVADAGQRPLTPPLTIAINLALKHAGIHDDHDMIVQTTVSASQALRLGTGRSVYATLAQVQQDATAARMASEENGSPLILMDRIA